MAKFIKTSFKVNLLVINSNCKNKFETYLFSLPKIKSFKIQNTSGL